MEKIRVLLDSTDRFEQSSIPILENFIQSQIKESQFNLEVSLALVKLYQFFPASLNYEVFIPLLVQLLANSQEQAFTTAMYMIPDSVVCQESIFFFHFYTLQDQFIHFFFSNKTKESPHSLHFQI